MRTNSLSRRTFLTFTAVLPWAWRAAGAKNIPVGLEMYSVRDELAKDPEGTVRAVAAMGYSGLEFYAPYFDWTEAQTRHMRNVLDDVGLLCYSTHNDVKYLSADNLAKVRERNQIL